MRTRFLIFYRAFFTQGAKSLRAASARGGFGAGVCARLAAVYEWAARVAGEEMGRD